jgi:hypothetical protein
MQKFFANSNPVGQPVGVRCPLSLRLLWCAILVFVAGCATESKHHNDPNRFSEGPFADVVLQFAKWDCIFATKPPLREHGYQRILNRDNVIAAVCAATPRRGLAVVVFSAEHTGDALCAAIADWIPLLTNAGFQRVVILRSGFEVERLDGLEILEDTQRQFHR